MVDTSASHYGSLLMETEQTHHHLALFPHVTRCPHFLSPCSPKYLLSDPMLQSSPPPQGRLLWRCHLHRKDISSVSPPPQPCSREPRGRPFSTRGLISSSDLRGCPACHASFLGPHYDRCICTPWRKVVMTSLHISLRLHAAAASSVLLLLLELLLLLHDVAVADCPFASSSASCASSPRSSISLTPSGTPHKREAKRQALLELVDYV